MFNEKSIVMGSNYSELSPKNGSESRTYKYTLKKGVQTGIGASSSGLGAMAHVTGVMHFTMIHLDENKKFQSLKTQYNFSAGTDNQGNTYNAFSSSDPKGDTGAVSTNGAQQPEVSNNNSAYGPLPN